MRNHIIDFLKKELIGPDPIPPYVQPNGEEVLFDLPRQRYGAGILYPQQYTLENTEKLSEEEKNIVESNKGIEDVEEVLDRTKIDTHGNYDEDREQEGFEEVVNLTNAYFPSAIGVSCFVEIPEKGFSVQVKAGRYKFDEFIYKDENQDEKKRKAYLRECINEIIHIKAEEIPPLPKQNLKKPIQVKEKDTGLVLYITNRSVFRGDLDKKCLLTFSLVNELLGNEGSFHDSEKCFFQVEMKIRSRDGKACFLPYPEKKYIQNEDDKINKLLYRNYMSYAIGHGCSAYWEESTIGRAKSVETRIIPDFEMKPILPAKLDNVELSMFNLSDYGDFNDGIRNLELLCSHYEEWIRQQEKRIHSLDTKLQDTASKQIKNCFRCLERIRDGIQLLQIDEKVQQAFQYMNRAMLSQQLRYSLPLRKWYENKSTVIKPFRNIDLFNKNTWPRSDLGHWRPFQIAFILMNLKSMALPESKERDIVDIIWFPTGGGKTEAYLGLSAFSIFLRRLKDPLDSGTSVLMRYTLRLLTTQQFQRAAALITACEEIRQDCPDILGSDRITIGLWVGDSLSPNTRQDAKNILSKMGQI
ncbi:hypothetical protein [Lihuaxuella thermophila]|uniref:Helicase conserved C-terminal domain-containing protein n=1 Tax=Lihuaxuella thermophila TaxID=1173111 RepID=A0A1H8EHG8_9BACL|nr:hypothetical protein [Lihuaxuella thermophila]SEN19021.1 hypothetical protein SAMN05444955_1071 [Lihuaxuella thermophila]